MDTRGLGFKNKPGDVRSVKDDSLKEETWNLIINHSINKASDINA